MRDIGGDTQVPKRPSWRPPKLTVCPFIPNQRQPHTLIANPILSILVLLLLTRNYTPHIFDKTQDTSKACRANVLITATYRVMLNIKSMSMRDPCKLV